MMDFYLIKYNGSLIDVLGKICLTSELARTCDTRRRK